jgi:hypothetical protein
MKPDFVIGKKYYTHAPIDEPNEDFVGKYNGVNSDGLHEFENSNGVKMAVKNGHFFKDATAEQVELYH